MTKHSDSWAVLPAGLAPAVALFLHGYLGSYSRPIADDFCSLYIARRFGLLRSIWYWRLTWSGRYSAFAVDWLEMKLLGAYGFQFVPPLALGLWLAFVIAAIFLGLRSASPDGGSVPAAILLGVAFLFVTLTLSPDVPQSLYWLNGMRSYALPLILLSLYAVLFQLWPKAAESRSRLWLGGALGFGLLFLSGGLSETFAAGQLFLLLFLIALRFASAPQRKPDAKSIVLIASLLGSILSLAVIISAPGNAARLAEREVSAPPPGLLELTTISLQAYAQLLANILATPEKITALIGASLLAAWLGARAEADLAPQARRIPLYLLGGLLVSMACFPPAVYGYHEPPPARTQIIPVFFLTAALLYASFLAGNSLKKNISRAFVHYGLPATAILLLGFSAFIESQALFRSREAYSAYARTWDELDAQILQAKADGDASVTIPAVQNWAGLNVLNDNPKFWVNACYTNFYGIPVLGPASD